MRLQKVGLGVVLALASGLAACHPESPMPSPLGSLAPIALADHWQGAALAGHSEVTQVETVEVKVRVEIPVKVVLADGQPAAGAAVFLQGEGGEPFLLETGEDGVARGKVEIPERARVRAAATSGDAWALSDWQSLESCRAGLLLPLGPAGILALESRNASGSPTLETHGWDLARLLELVGAGPQIYAGTPLLVAGLPVGEYVVTLGSTTRKATVRPQATVLVVFE